MQIRLPRPEQIALFTDFGVSGPYVGQMYAVLQSRGVKQPVYDLMNDVPCFNPKAGAYLLKALSRTLPVPTLVLSVVDPGVGGGRKPIVVQSGEHIYVGPDNGLLSRVATCVDDAQAFVIEWQPECLSKSFHGRDLFSPISAMLAKQEAFQYRSLELSGMIGHSWSKSLEEVIYLDHYGNAVLGIAASELPGNPNISVGNYLIQRAGVFEEVPVGTPFWYENSMGLVEIAVNQGSANESLGLEVGSSVVIG